MKDCEKHYICECMAKRLHNLEKRYHEIYLEGFEHGRIDQKRLDVEIAETFRAWSPTGGNWSHSKNVANQIARKIRGP